MNNISFESSIPSSSDSMESAWGAASEAVLKKVYTKKTKKIMLIYLKYDYCRHTVDLRGVPSLYLYATITLREHKYSKFLSHLQSASWDFKGRGCFCLKISVIQAWLESWCRQITGYRPFPPFLATSQLLLLMKKFPSVVGSPQSVPNITDSTPRLLTISFFV